MALIHGFLKMAHAANSGAPHVNAYFGAADLHKDYLDGGLYHVSGTTKVAGTPDVPVARRVGLFCKISKRLVREIFSGADGTYDFSYIRSGPWFVVAFDHTGEYNAVIADNRYGDPM